MVFLTAFFIHKGSAESKDTEEEMNAKLDHIQAQLEQLVRERNPE